MSGIERLTITLPSEMAGLLKAAVNDGDYASTSEVVREALRDWKLKKAMQSQALEELRRDIATGVADLEAGRVTEPNLERIADLGRRRAAIR